MIVILLLFFDGVGSSCCTGAFSTFGEQGLLFVVGHGLFIAVASCCRAQTLGSWASVTAVCGSVVEAYGL